MSDWYTRLTEYFPEKEMKSKKHFEILFQEKKGMYQLLEGPDYVLVYFEQSDYIFIDFILVGGGSRGKGIGSMVLDHLKKEGKAIILEVEPATVKDPDSEKRIRFYEMNDFLKMNSIQYERIHMVTNELNKMDIFCWSPVHRTEQWVYDKMKAVYDEVHAFKARELYGRNPQPVSDVLWMRELIYS
ncbi:MULTISPECIES: GNAT family N-acetyltransferase [Bacillaceae]|uniref:GNAT family N-acetyltransferase n=1 Tax=Bacillaceae TaxID=186817 RepID=UPI0013EAB220|nr:GNAT family N-acetyltransferase [Ectobacillus funiculus]